MSLVEDLIGDDRQVVGNEDLLVVAPDDEKQTLPRPAGVDRARPGDGLRYHPIDLQYHQISFDSTNLQKEHDLI